MVYNKCRIINLLKEADDDIWQENLHTMRNSTQAKKGKVFSYTADNLRPAIIVIREIKNHISDEPSVHFNLANMLGRQKIEIVVRDIW